MDKDAKDANGLKNDDLIRLDGSKVEDKTDDVEDDSESNSLLPPRRGGMSRNSDKVRRKVQWNDKNGHKLVEVVEFEPSYENSNHFSS
ncbi:hypothetical protein K2173_003741 [Erythroxylum novogranatense]|uniref:Uncharacterized protein n=1 Tax=Erythroxylum novogranatense TaxID=1862640 RepID=A0AAV8TCB4_9ROSI|nr:hypothetical protein K2173_003741 [Erythroxylum novogranatense]